LPKLERVRATAEAIGRISCIKTGEEIGLLYRWDNGETQATLYDEGILTTLGCSAHAGEPDVGAKRG
jgi:hypothetical protein